MHPQEMRLSLEEGTFERIAAVLKGTETRVAFVRKAIERELVRREQSPATRSRRECD